MYLGTEFFEAARCAGHTINAGEYNGTPNQQSSLERMKHTLLKKGSYLLALYPTSYWVVVIKSWKKTIKFSWVIKSTQHQLNHTIPSSVFTMASSINI